MYYKQIFTIVSLIVLGGCQHFSLGQAKTVVDDPSVVIFEEPKPAVVRSNAEIMSGENVIVYPVDGDLSLERKTFPEYRGVMENTTRGGYTVFDSSVTVFSVEGRTDRPEYLPHYSVPKYAEQYRAQPVATRYNDNGPLMPITGQAQQKTSAPLAITPTGRRSAPVLTAYE